MSRGLQWRQLVRREYLVENIRVEFTWDFGKDGRIRPGERMRYEFQIQIEYFIMLSIWIRGKRVHKSSLKEYYHRLLIETKSAAGKDGITSVHSAYQADITLHCLLEKNTKKRLITSISLSYINYYTRIQLYYFWIVSSGWIDPEEMLTQELQSNPGK